MLECQKCNNTLWIKDTDINLYAVGTINLDSPTRTNKEYTYECQECGATITSNFPYKIMFFIQDWVSLSNREETK